MSDKSKATRDSTVDLLIDFVPEPETTDEVRGVCEAMLNYVVCAMSRGMEIKIGSLMLQQAVTAAAQAIEQVLTSPKRN